MNQQNAQRNTLSWSDLCDRARRWIREQGEDLEQDARYRNVQGQIDRTRHRTKSAIERFEQVIEEDPEGIALHLHDQGYIVRTYGPRGDGNSAKYLQSLNKDTMNEILTADQQRQIHETARYVERSLIASINDHKKSVSEEEKRQKKFLVTNCTWSNIIRDRNLQVVYKGSVMKVLLLLVHEALEVPSTREVLERKSLIWGFINMVCGMADQMEQILSIQLPLRFCLRSANGRLRPEEMRYAMPDPIFDSEKLYPGVVPESQEDVFQFDESILNSIQL